MADRSASLAFILSLTDKVTAPLGKVKMGFSELADQSEKHIKTIGLGLGGLTAGVVGIRESMEPALEVNRALGDVRSLGVAEDALSALNAKSLEFAVNYGENAQEFVASAYLIEGAIKGLAGNQLAVFTNTSNLLAKATKSDAETMGEYVGTLYNLQKSQADAMGKGEWVERLGGQTALAVQLFRTSGAAMKDAFKEAGAIATTAGVDLAEQMAVIGTLSSTMEGGDAGGRYKAFFENLSTASDKLGVKFTDQQGKILPIMTILDKLQGKLGDLNSASAGAKLLEAFGGEGAQVIGALAKDTSRLRNGIEQLGKVRGLENAENMARAMVDPWQQWASLVEVMRVVFGQVLIPVLTPFMNRMIEIGKTLVRWSQLFPNITRLIGITALTIMGIVAAMSLLTVVVGVSRMTWMSLVSVWKVVQLLNLRTVAGFVLQKLAILAYMAVIYALSAGLALVRGAMLLWQGAIWLVNAALLANPVVWIVVAIVALVAMVVAAVYYWDEWTTALMNTAAFQFVAEQFQKLSDWFDSMGGWSGMARAAWDSIVSIFTQAVNGVIELLNSIPGVNIEARFGGMPEVPGIDAAATAADTASAAQKAQQTINAAIPSLSPTRPAAVPPGGLLTSIQNNSSNQNKGTHVENVNIHTGKAMTPLEVENMVAMAVGG
ncbi:MULTISPECIES: phage tail tape measure protein [unclassified Pseudomonas]|uniref:phage tail tape measure protein n=1 Tax=unclassified Pseudomonas TaxID=196821 RepID=UPI000916C925|nr:MULTISPECIES: phage tail tape measure protein [unclassified Pseudomonas]SFX92433.1 phage tail tape measure protein, TP901 family, core region [Pseudomonas sp. NFACC43]SFY29422.1 phage tail tape measure protein, TP901 family, core region [Pseudomonas sp. NFACC47-1]